MSAQIINGKEIALSMNVNIAHRVDEIKKKFNITPTLAVIMVGNDPASEIYVGNKEKSAHSVGMNSIQFKLAQDIAEIDLISKIEELNNDKNVHGILVQLPLPNHIDAKKVIHKINPNKDVDGFNVVNVGKLSIGEVDGVDKAIIPCTPIGCIHLLKFVLGNNLAGLKTLVIGSSNIVGRPLTRLLMLENCTVTVANSKTKNLKAECSQSDVIFSGAGVPKLITADMVKKGAVVIDIGINRISKEGGGNKIVGDVDFEEVKKVASAITPVPGGVGPMTIAYLLQNTLDCCLRLVLKN
jgi:methylenetetrahydrofolate dehydrogenase (NADP+) / methenyltetrahydrofolate cyclohydrolase